MNRKAQSVLHQRRKSIGSRARSTRAVEFFNVLTSPQLLETKVSAPRMKWALAGSVNRYQAKTSQGLGAWTGGEVFQQPAKGIYLEFMG